MTAVSNRVGVKSLIVTTLEAAFAAQTSNPDLRTVTVHYGDPGENTTDEMVVVGTIDGNVEAEVFGPVGTDDEFTIRCVIDVTGYASELEADQRAQAILDELNAALFQTNFAQATYGARVFPAAQDGPNGSAPVAGEPASSVVDLTIGCSVRVRGT